jgi:ADP-ribosylation factor GTPase-activating protein 1
VKLVLQFAEGDFAKQAQLTAAQLARQAQQAGKSAQDGFSKFVDGPEGRPKEAMDDSRKSFWDDFSSIGTQNKPSNSAIGTSAMGMGKSRGGAGSGAAQKPEQSDEWDDW